MKRKIKSLALVFFLSLNLMSCSNEVTNLNEKVANIWSNKVEGALKPETIKDLANKVGLGDLGNFKVDIITNGITIDYGDGVKDVEGIKHINMDKKLAILLSLLKNVDHVEIKYNGEVKRLDRESLKNAFNINIDELTKSKEDLTNYLKDALKR